MLAVKTTISVLIVSENDTYWHVIAVNWRYKVSSFYHLTFFKTCSAAKYKFKRKRRKNIYFQLCHVMEIVSISEKSTILLVSYDANKTCFRLEKQRSLEKCPVATQKKRCDVFLFSFLCLKNLACVAMYVCSTCEQNTRNADEPTFPGQGFWRIYNQVRDNKTIMKRDTIVEIYERLWKANETGYFTIDPIFISILRKSKIVYFPVAAILIFVKCYKSRSTAFYECVKKLQKLCSCTLLYVSLLPWSLFTQVDFSNKS